MIGSRRPDEAPRDRLGFIEVIASGRLVRLGEAALVGHATVVADPRHLDVVFAGPPLQSPCPLGLWLFHYPGVPPLEGALAAVRAGLAAHAAAAGRTRLPQPDVLRWYPTLPERELPDLSIVVGRLPEGYGLHCRASLFRALWPALPYIVEALEEYLCSAGFPPRLIREIRPLAGEALEEAAWTLPTLVARRPRGQHGQGQANATTRRPAPEQGPAGTPRAARVARGRGGSGSAAPEGEPAPAKAGDRWWKRLLAAVGAGARQDAPPAVRRGRMASLTRPRQRVVRPARAGRRTLGQLDLPRTVVEAASRGARTGEGRFRLAEEDLRFAIQPERDDPDRCLLLDTSASMAGSRARALQQMADFLLRNSRGRVAVVAFSGGTAQVVSGFTRSRRALREAMARLRPSGLTPLAAGLMLSLDLVRSSGRHGEVILLTDGEPTRALWSHSSEQDSYRAGEALRRAGVRLVCCGLRANEGFLAELAERGGGRLFVLRDFSSGSLLALSRGLLAQRT
ncbi:MAG: VWA domain-containing protein [Chitinophagales bacterium]